MPLALLLGKEEAIANTLSRYFDEVIGFIPARFGVTNQRIPPPPRTPFNEAAPPGPVVRGLRETERRGAFPLRIGQNRCHPQFPLEERRRNETRPVCGLNGRRPRQTGVTDHRNPLSHGPTPRELSHQCMAAWF